MARKYSLRKDVIQCQPLLVYSWDCPQCDEHFMTLPPTIDGFKKCAKCHNRFDAKDFLKLKPALVKQMLEAGAHYTGGE